MHKQNIRIELEKKVSWSNGQVHQAIIDVSYDAWNDNRLPEVNDYGKMIAYIEETYGTASALAVLLGKYNYQVTGAGTSVGA